MNTKRSTHPKLYAARLLMALGLVGASWPVHAFSLRVPTDYRTIQTAIDAAAPGDTVIVRSGTYTEQLRISKDIEMVGAGAGSTIIRAPAKLSRGVLHETASSRFTMGP